MAPRIASIVATLFIAAACQLPGAHAGCSNVAIDWVNFIQVGSTQYVAGADSTAQLKESDLGPVYAKVKFKVKDNVCDPSYRLKDGDAAFLAPGTPIYRVNGQSPDEQLAARFNGSILLYLAIQAVPSASSTGATPPA
jgi:hypothetical protein